MSNIKSKYNSLLFYFNIRLILTYEGESISSQPVPFPMDRDGHDFHALFQYMFIFWVQNCTHIDSTLNKIFRRINVLLSRNFNSKVPSGINVMPVNFK